MDERKGFTHSLRSFSFEPFVSIHVLFIVSLELRNSLFNLADGKSDQRALFFISHARLKLLESDDKLAFGRTDQSDFLPFTDKELGFARLSFPSSFIILFAGPVEWLKFSITQFECLCWNPADFFVIIFIVKLSRNSFSCRQCLVGHYWKALRGRNRCDLQVSRDLSGEQRDENVGKHQQKRHQRRAQTICRFLIIMSKNCIITLQFRSPSLVAAFVNCSRVDWNALKVLVSFHLSAWTTAKVVWYLWGWPHLGSIFVEFPVF